MANIVTFDGPNKLIIEVSAAGDNVLEASEVYSEWKFWVTQSDNAKYLQAFTPVGGDPITGTESLDITYFLENGWRIRPAELDHKLAVEGNLYTREKDDIINRLFLYALENGESFAEAMRLIRAEAAGSIEKVGDVHRVKSNDGAKDRVVATADETGRTVTGTDVT